MSIITEALTKAQEKRKNETHPAEEKIIKIQASVPDIKKEAQPLEEIKSAFSIKSALILGLILTASAAILIFTPLIHRPSATENKPLGPPIAQAPQPIQQAAPKPTPISVPYKFSLTNPAFEFSLEGIISGNGAPAAIINKQVVGVGDTVKGAVVMAINEDEVILDYNGEEILLQIN